MIRWTVTDREDGGVDVCMDGEITETVDFDQITKRSSGRIMLDLDGVRRINSFGVRNVLEFLRAQDELVDVERCRPVMVQQLGMIPELSARVRVRSLYVPFECPRCFAAHEEIVTMGRGRPRLEPPQCPTCRAPMQLAEPEDRYFAFLDD